MSTICQALPPLRKPAFVYHDRFLLSINY